MFTFVGQPFKKNDQDFGPWEARKAAGDGGEFGGGLPQAFFTDNDKSMRCGQFGAIMRSFGIRYGFYDPKDWGKARYIDPIVDTFADVLNAQAAFAFAEDDAGREAGCTAYENTVGKFMGLIEANMKHHGGKFAAGDSITIADFVVAGHMQACSLNKASPMPFYGICQKVLPGHAAYQAYE